MRLSTEQRQRLLAVMVPVVQAVAQWLADMVAVIRRAVENLGPMFAALRAAQARRPLWSTGPLGGRR